MVVKKGYLIRLSFVLRLHAILKYNSVPKLCMFLGIIIQLYDPLQDLNSRDTRDLGLKTGNTWFCPETGDI